MRLSPVSVVGGFPLCSVWPNFVRPRTTTTALGTLGYFFNWTWVVFPPVDVLELPVVGTVTILTYLEGIGRASGRETPTDHEGLRVWFRPGSFSGLV